MPDPLDLLTAVDRSFDRVGYEQRQLLRSLAEADAGGLGSFHPEARDLAHLLSMRYGLSCPEASRWIEAAHALERLPTLAAALENGSLGIRKVLELARFATPETEERLIRWARTVSAMRIRQAANAALRPSGEAAERARVLEWWYDQDGTMLNILVRLASAHCERVLRVLRRVAADIPELPGEEGPAFDGARLADALVQVAEGGLGGGADAVRNEVVVHVTEEGLATGERGETEDGGLIPAETVERLLCHSRIRVVWEDPAGNPLRVSRRFGAPTEWETRQLRRRDRECRFPGCGARRYTQAHHVRWVSRGGETRLDNLVLLCGYHHRLVHEHGWNLQRRSDNAVTWRRPGGRVYVPGPAPPVRLVS